MFLTSRKLFMKFSQFWTSNSVCEYLRGTMQDSAKSPAPWWFSHPHLHANNLKVKLLTLREF